MEFRVVELCPGSGLHANATLFEDFFVHFNHRASNASAQLSRGEGGRGGLHALYVIFDRFALEDIVDTGVAVSGLRLGRILKIYR
jgi:hypothetical protein